MPDVTILQNCMTEEQRDHFDQQGYLIVPDALDDEMLGRILEASDRVDREERQAKGIDPGALMSKFRTIVEDDAYLDLLDLPRTFPLVCDILGWNIQHYISHLIYYPPEPAGSADLKPGGWHQDGGRPVPEMERPQPRLSLKVAFWLSDISQPENGGIRIIPGSHKWDRPPDLEIDRDDILQVQVPVGTAVIFDRRMWHARGHNSSDITRKVLFLGYSYRWLRGLDYNMMPDDILERCDPIRRQLLGDGVDVKGWWQPTDADVPLKTWLAEHMGSDYLEQIGQRQWEREKWGQTIE
ncbi:MAG: phytanoyl-CoA dioxygenase [Gemmatimonadetes bacterium]|jgi:ectoine hydroxylase|nr:phytanoyl-CoA dioxygenase [Gemmatimonadota bacterium]MBT6143969.1 phytanoyl-CoA dioxygenase [Gemmatimonadota bacterium]MBT7864415.1 phytanoyl-CoA dioxygenase [Gemmatimonadota bacterium]